MENALEILLQSHEARLGRVESTLTENTRQTAECLAKVGAVDEKISLGYKSLTEKIVVGFDDITKTLVALQDKVEAIDQRVETQRGHLIKLKEQASASQKIKRWVVATTLSGILSAIGFTLTRFGDHIWSLIHKKGV